MTSIGVATALGLRKKLLKSGFDLAIGHAAQQGLRLLRNIIVARLIGPEDFGIAVTFAIVITVLQMVSDVGVEQFIVRSADGDKRELQATLHGVIAIRGILIGIAIVLLSDLFARLFDVPEVAWVYRLLALVPIIKGFAHLDVRRFHRHLQYRPGILVEVAGLSMALLTAVLVGIYLRSYEAVLWAYLVEAIVFVIASHFVAERPYRVTISWSVLERLIVFGWPLMLNGMVLFAIGQGDRVIVGSYLGVYDLANYAVVAIIAAGLSHLVMKLTGSLYVPILSAPNVDATTLAKRYHISGAIAAFAACVALLLLVVLGPALIETLYGDQYRVSAFLAVWFGVLTGAKILRSWPVAAALATGDTKEILYSNMFRGFGLLLSVGMIAQGYGGVGVAFSVAVGELLSAGFILLRSNFFPEQNDRIGRGLYFTFLTLVVVSILASNFGLQEASLPLRLGVICLILVCSSIAIFLIVPESWIYTRSISRDWVGGRYKHLSNRSNFRKDE